jgi:phospholipid-transporting ATPase
MMCLAYCHTIITAEDEVEVQYNASSPDELALANLARFCGWKFMGINEENFMCVYVRGEQVEYKYRLLQVLEFNSTRKRMSVLLQDD